MVSLDLLESMKTFKGLNEAQLTVLQGLSEKLKFNRNDRLFLQGDESEHLWFVINGRIELRDDQPKQSAVAGDNPISFISETEVFGWSSFMLPYKYRLSGYCSSRECEVIRIRKKNLIGVFEKDPKVGFTIMSYLLGVIGTHLHQLQDEIAQRKGQDIMTQW
jgi:CRP-like cAMP-binding protein